jgi:RNA polymerase sigma factor FliA
MEEIEMRKSSAILAELTPPQGEGDDVISQHLYVVMQVVLKLNLPYHVDISDAFQEGVLALIDARSRFDASLGIPFGVFARMRVWGQMKDYQRDEDYLPRALRTFCNKRVRAITKFVREHSRTPESEEIATAMGLTLKRYFRLESRVNLCAYTSSCTPYGQEGDETVREEVIPPTHENAPDLALMARILDGEAGDLPDRDYILLRSYYRDWH